MERLIKPDGPFLHHKLTHFQLQERDIGILNTYGFEVCFAYEINPWNAAQKKSYKTAIEYCKSNDVDFAKIVVHHFLETGGASVYLLGIQEKELVNTNLDTCLNGLTENETNALMHVKEK